MPKVLMVMILVLLIAVAVAAYGSSRMITHGRYVGDPNTKIVYDLKNCDVQVKKSFVSFKSREEAQGYVDADCS